MLLCQTGVKVLSLMPSLLMRRASLYSSKVNFFTLGLAVPSFSVSVSFVYGKLKPPFLNLEYSVNILYFLVGLLYIEFHILRLTK